MKASRSTGQTRLAIICSKPPWPYAGPSPKIKKVHDRIMKVSWRSGEGGRKTVSQYAKRKMEADEAVGHEWEFCLAQSGA